jgi:hypothetical protein
VKREECRGEKNISLDTRSADLPLTLVSFRISIFGFFTGGSGDNRDKCRVRKKVSRVLPLGTRRSVLLSEMREGGPQRGA